MPAYVLKRLGEALVTAFFVFTFVFFAMRLLPGDPVIAMLGDRADAKTVENVRRSLGLDRPLLEQYAMFLWGIVHLDLGRSLVNGLDVGTTMFRQLPYTIMLTLASTLIGMIVGIPAGVASAMRAGQAADHVSRVVSLSGRRCPISISASSFCFSSASSSAGFRCLARRKPAESLLSRAPRADARPAQGLRDDAAHAHRRARRDRPRLRADRPVLGLPGTQRGVAAYRAQRDAADHRAALRDDGGDTGRHHRHRTRVQPAGRGAASRRRRDVAATTR